MDYGLAEGRSALEGKSMSISEPRSKQFNGQFDLDQIRRILTPAWGLSAKHS